MRPPGINIIDHKMRLTPVRIEHLRMRLCSAFMAEEMAVVRGVAGLVSQIYGSEWPRRLARVMEMFGEPIPIPKVKPDLPGTRFYLASPPSQFDYSGFPDPFANAPGTLIDEEGSWWMSDLPEDYLDEPGEVWVPDDELQMMIEDVFELAPLRSEQRVSSKRFRSFLAAKSVKTATTPSDQLVFDFPL